MITFHWWRLIALFLAAGLLGMGVIRAAIVLGIPFEIRLPVVVAIAILVGWRLVPKIVPDDPA